MDVHKMMQCQSCMQWESSSQLQLHNISDDIFVAKTFYRCSCRYNVFPSLYISPFLSIFLLPSITLFASLRLHLYVSFSLFLSLHPIFFFPPLYIFLPTFPSFLSLSLSLSLSFSLSLSLSLPRCLLLFFSFLFTPRSLFMYFSKGFQSSF